MLKKIKLFLLSFFTLTLVLLGLLVFLLFYPKEFAHNYQLKVTSGQGMSAVSRVLEKDDVVYRHEILLFGAYAMNMESSLTKGNYRLNSPISPWDILHRLRDARPDTVTIRMGEGLNIKKVREIISKNQDLQHETIALSDKELLQLIDSKSPYTSLEGLLFPDSYIFADKSSDLTVYRYAYHTLKKHLQNTWEHRADNLPYENMYQMLIMASIIEKETALEADRANVAAVFVNRLRKNMRLQTDPTVIYGMGDAYKGNIRKVDLRRDTPYNTYTRYGLPPTPISSVSLASLRAAAHPADSSYLYFVARKDGTGSSQFSNSLAEHNRAVRKYIFKK